MSGRVSRVHLPNVLTLFRILLVPVLVLALLEETPNGDLLAAIVFAVASLTDAVDGYLARAHDAVTDFGKLMDPIADKLLVLGALVTLVGLDRLDAWVAVVILGREFAVTVSRMAATSQGFVIPASAWGKVKTTVQVACVLLLIAVAGSPWWLDGVVYATVAVTIASGVDYFLGVRRLFRAAEQGRPAATDTL